MGGRGSNSTQRLTNKPQSGETVNRDFLKGVIEEEMGIRPTKYTVVAQDSDGVAIQVNDNRIYASMKRAYSRVGDTPVQFIGADRAKYDTVIGFGSGNVIDFQQLRRSGGQSKTTRPKSGPRITQGFIDKVLEDEIGIRQFNFVYGNSSSKDFTAKLKARQYNNLKSSFPNGKMSMRGSDGRLYEAKLDFPAKGAKSFWVSFEDIKRV